MRHKEIERQTNREINRQRHKQIETQTDRDTNRQRHKQIETQTETQSNTDTKQIETQTNTDTKQIETQTNTDTKQIETHRDGEKGTDRDRCWSLPNVCNREFIELFFKKISEQHSLIGDHPTHHRNLLTMGQCNSENVNNCLNTNIYSYLETSWRSKY